MKKVLRLVLVAVLAFGASACAAETNVGGLEDGEADRAAVSALVDTFGQKLQMVSVLAPEDVLLESIREDYSDLVTPDLLEKWKADLSLVPGRQLSSPWPDRIEVTGVEAVSGDEYTVEGNIIEVTSVEVEQRGAAATRPVTLTVVRAESGWLIDDITLGEYADAVVYKNTEYGFSFVLPKSWEGYSIVMDEWEGLAVGEDGTVDEDPAEIGPIVRIRHPDWTSDNVRQDIPIMVFTLDQWTAMVDDEEFHIGAGPMNPSELARSDEYVFALPARYNYAFPEGFEEVEDILAAQPMRIMPVKAE